MPSFNPICACTILPGSISARSGGEHQGWHPGQNLMSSRLVLSPHRTSSSLAAVLAGPMNLIISHQEDFLQDTRFLLLRVFAVGLSVTSGRHWLVEEGRLRKAFFWMHMVFSARLCTLDVEALVPCGRRRLVNSRGHLNDNYNSCLWPGLHRWHDIKVRSGFQKWCTMAPLYSARPSGQIVKQAIFPSIDFESSCSSLIQALVRPRSCCNRLNILSPLSCNG